MLPPCKRGFGLLPLPPDTTPLPVPLLGLPADPRPLPSLPLADDPELLLESVNEGDPLLLEEVE